MVPFHTYNCLGIYFFLLNLVTAEFPNMFENREGRVVNGFDTRQPLPYQLQLVRELNWGKAHFCGATLVTKKYATTAHHCFTGVNFDYVTVIAGQYEKNNPFGHSSSIQASSPTNVGNFNNSYSSLETPPTWPINKTGCGIHLKFFKFLEKEDAKCFLAL